VTYELVDQKGEALLRAVVARAAQVPFPQRDRHELWSRMQHLGPDRKRAHAAGEAVRDGETEPTAVLVTRE